MAGPGRLVGKVAIVSGASKGIGRAIAERLAADGAHVVLFSRSEAPLKAAVVAICAAGGSASYKVADAASEAEVQAVVTSTVSEHHRLDIMVINAGIFPEVRLEDMTLAQWDEVHNLNLRGTYIAAKAAIPPMKVVGAGRIVLVASVTGDKVGLPGFSHYAASKAGQVGFMRSAAIELAKYKITVNAVLPGNIATEGWLEGGAALMDNIQKAIPMGHFGAPADIAAAVAFLASDDASFVTGHGLVVDGGQTLPESHHVPY